MTSRIAERKLPGVTRSAAMCSCPTRWSRTTTIGYEATVRLQAVMDGDLDGFIFAYLKAASRGDLKGKIDMRDRFHSTVRLAGAAAKGHPAHQDQRYGPHCAESRPHAGALPAGSRRRGLAFLRPD